MAQFTANFVKRYDSGSGLERIVGGNPAFQTGTYTLSDGEENTTFERDIPTDSGLAGDPIATDGIALADASYRGQFNVVVNGTSHTVIVIQTPGDLWVFGNIPGITDTDLPDDLITGSPATPIFSDEPFTVCFAAGTLIATPEGERAVERLRIGDAILTSDSRTVPVRWIGLQTRHKALTRARDFAPVRVKAGALGDSLPHTDLILTGDHALIVDGLAINAAALVNGTTIAFEPMDSLPDTVTYYHIETENHEEILANGAPAETFVDYVGRKSFDNHQEYLDLYGCERIIPEMRRPRISARRQLPPATAARFGIAPFGADVEADAADLMARLAVA